MTIAYFTMPSREHLPLFSQTTDAMCALDGIRDAGIGDVVAVSSLYTEQGDKPLERKSDAKAWVIADNGIEAVSIFDIEPARIPVASMAMMHSEQDAVLHDLGETLGEILGKTPDESREDGVDLACLNVGLVALRRLPDFMGPQNAASFEENLPRIAMPFIPKGLTRPAAMSVCYDLSVFLSLVFSTKPRGQSAAGKSEPMPKTTITIRPPDRG